MNKKAIEAMGATPVTSEGLGSQAATTKTVSPAILAARAFNRIEALIKRRDEELLNAPASIEGRYVRKIADARKGLSAEAAELLDGMLEKASRTEAIE